MIEGYQLTNIYMGKKTTKKFMGKSGGRRQEWNDNWWYYLNN